MLLRARRKNYCRRFGTPNRGWRRSRKPKDKIVYSLDMGAYNAQIREIDNESVVKRSCSRRFVIIHRRNSTCGVGAEGADAANILEKLPWHVVNSTCYWATTLDEYQKYFERRKLSKDVSRK
jgi:ATP-dependent Clp protease ATP-binding subunit ClpA